MGNSTLNELKIAIEAAQQLANNAEQPVALFTDKKGIGIDYDVIGSLEELDKILVLEVFNPQ